MNFCPECGMGPRGIEADECQNCGHQEEEIDAETIIRELEDDLESEEGDE